MDPRQLFRPSTLHEDLGAVGGSTEEANISVYLRLRPTPTGQNIYRVSDNMIEVHNIEEKQPNKEITEKQFQFTKIFEDSATQKAIYERAVYPDLKNIFYSTGATFVAYGASNSGKTFTVMGDPDNPGIIPRAIGQLYGQFEGRIAGQPLLKTDFQMNKENLLYEDEVSYEMSYSSAILSESQEKYENFRDMLETITDEHKFGPIEDCDLSTVTFYVSFIEIYKEVVKDLLDYGLDTVKPLKVISNGGESFVHNANWVFAGSAINCLAILDYAMTRAHFGSTGVNAKSSRSHMIFFVNVIATYNDDTVQRAVFKFCDLAGAERTKKTLAAGDRLMEAKKINLSLVTLGRCLQVIHNNQVSGAAQGLVPVRDSKVTLLLQSALLGAEKLSMIVNMLPVVKFFDENLNVLNFSAIAKNIVVKKFEKPKKRQSSMHLAKPLRRSTLFSKPSFSITHEGYLDEIDRLRVENEELQRQLLAQEMSLRHELVDKFAEMGKSKDEYWKELVERKMERLTNQYEAKIARMKERFNEDMEDLENEIERKNHKLRKWKRKYDIEEEVSSSEDSEEEEESDEEQIVEITSESNED